MSDGDDVRLKRVRFLCWHRSTREMDIILGSWFDKMSARLTSDQITLLENLLREPDEQLYLWLVKRTDDYPSGGRGELLKAMSSDIHPRSDQTPAEWSGL